MECAHASPCTEHAILIQGAAKDLCAVRAQGCAAFQQAEAALLIQTAAQGSAQTGCANKK